MNNNEDLYKEIKVPKHFEKEGQQKNSGLSEDEMKKLNIPPRDEERYPMPSKEEIEKAGSFLYKLNLLASNTQIEDMNLQALIWNLYIRLEAYLNGRNENNESIDLALSLEDLKEYLDNSPSVIMKNILKNENGK